MPSVRSQRSPRGRMTIGEVRRKDQFRGHSPRTCVTVHVCDRAELPLKIFLPARAWKVDDEAAIEHIKPVVR